MNLIRISLRFICIFLMYLFIQIRHIASDGVLGCGGFVKSDVEINYSLVEVKLYTTHGSIKYQTDCAPNSGYYLVPLYDKGDYILKVEPPRGWTFEPESVSLHIDGTTDKCSLGEDINFKFTGFTVSGKVVSKGQSEGPSGVTVVLKKSGSNDILQTVANSDGGGYIFTMVMPGDYTISAQHPAWNLQKAETLLKVVNDNVNVGEDVIISGYDVMGKVYSEGEPIKGVNFILLSEKVKASDVSGCEKTDVKGFNNPGSSPALCHVISADDGTFTFRSLSHGSYSVVPFYKGEHIKFDVVPVRMEFTVGHGSVLLEPEFRVTGFSVSGRVFDSRKGVGVANARILIGGREQTVTNRDGSYHLENMKTGSYRLQVVSDKIFFDETEVKINPNTPQLPDIVATSFSLCGKVTIDRLPESMGQTASQRKLTLHPEGQSSEVTTVETATDGTYCTRLRPGKYVVKVLLKDFERKAGLLLMPDNRIIAITNKPVLDVSFYQFRAKVSGEVACLEKCSAMDLSLDPIGRTDGKQYAQVHNVDPKSATFTFDKVLPGKYKVTLLQDSWCWKEKLVEFEVLDKDVSGLEFKQTGYILKCTLSHAISLHFAHEKKKGSVGSFQLNKGKNRFCLSEPGMYQLTPDSCHRFEKSLYSYDTSNPELLSLTAVKHYLNGSLKTEERVNDIRIHIRSSIDKEQIVVLGPLKSDKEPGPSKDGKKPAEPKGPFIYAFEYLARTGERLDISASSSLLLFYPPKVDVMIHGDTCPDEVAEMRGKRGVFISGQIIPPLSAVVITIKATDESSDETTLETDDKGSFRVGPLHGDKNYSVSAEKVGYVLTPVEEMLGHFKAFKLGEVNVQVLNEVDKPLSSVLLSLSGGAGYRNNNLTDQGIMNFRSLSPGQYFLRPMMKEFRFDPASQMIDVLEGSSVQIKIKGYRVAYSCFGRVTSLNGEPEPGIIVEAIGQDPCSMYQEDGKTEADGSYRLRGLEPRCTYELRLKSGDINRHIDRAAPKSQLLVVENKDFVDVNIIAFRRTNQMDISGNIVASLDHLGSLKVRLFREDAPDSPMHTVSMATNCFFYLPSLPIDGQKYSLRLESSLSKTSFDYTLPEISFESNVTYKHFTIKFQPQRKAVDQDFNQGSFLVLPLTIVVLFLAYYHKKVLPIVTQWFIQVQSMLAAKQSGQDASPDLDLSDASAAKKKIKVRKI